MNDYSRLSAAFGARLDLVDEASQVLRGDANVEISGVSEQAEDYGHIHISTVEILREDAAQRLGKKMGRYITIDIPPVVNQEDIDIISELVGQKLALLLPELTDDSCVLLFGLGNNNATPDALGPQVVERTFATRHIFSHTQEQIEGVLRPLAALAPGVLGITGIETAEMIRGVAGHVQPAAMIVVDSLAAASLSRVGTTIQLTDTGISPGAGIGNNRQGVDTECMGLPVIAIGVPTVVNSIVIIYEALTQMLDYGKSQGFNVLPALDENLLEKVSTKVLKSFDGNLIVTPKDIDQLVTDAAEIIAGAVAQAVHPGVNRENYQDYLR